MKKEKKQRRDEILKDVEDDAEMLEILEKGGKLFSSGGNVENSV